jgi:hypothetical protein
MSVFSHFNSFGNVLWVAFSIPSGSLSRKINELLGLKKYAQKRDDLMTLETCYFGTYEKKRDVHKIMDIFLR